MKTTKSIGKKFGRLKILKVVGRNKHNKLIVKCFCDCGKTINKVLEYIQEGDTQSCGCRAVESFKRIITKHGFAKTRFYGIYYAVHQRTNNSKTIKWKYYGGRGIKCLWKSFEEFRDDMYKSYLKHVKIFGEKQTTIDRINTNKHYCKNNCRWATYKEQSINKRKRIIKHRTDIV